MKVSHRFTFLVIISLFGVACSKDNRPSEDHLRNSFNSVIPSYFAVEEFQIDVSQNIGNEVEPIYGTRFSSVVSSKADLFKSDHEDQEIVFLLLVTEKNNDVNAFGKINSKLYQGAWHSSVDIDGDVFGNLGQPIEQFSNRRTIIIGSGEERAYREQQEEKRIALEDQRRLARAALEAKQQAFYGKWKLTRYAPAGGTWQTPPYRQTLEVFSGGRYEINGGPGAWTAAQGGDSLVLEKPGVRNTARLDGDNIELIDMNGGRYTFVRVKYE